ncbi:MAG: hypothetical protein M1820_005767 [Bogoriella megaspora]|nr:MAG: hypothetical protein M1820_005767 [Bogoriella megaspora]
MSQHDLQPAAEYCCNRLWSRPDKYNVPMNPLHPPSSLGSHSKANDEGSPPINDSNLLTDSQPGPSKIMKFDWSSVPQQYSVESPISLPSPLPRSIPRIQAKFGSETSTERRLRLSRLDAVKSNFTHAWKGYQQYAWLRDEVKPLSGKAQNPFGGWAATLVDSLDSLWIMDLQDEFEEAVDALGSIDFSTCSLHELNIFETTARYLGGFLAAYDLSEGKYPILLYKAKEMDEMLYKAFDTLNRMPVTRWNFKAAKRRDIFQEAPDSALVAEVGSLTLEWTRLAQLTGDMRYYDAVARIMNIFTAQQAETHLPGMFAVLINTQSADFTQDSGFGIGGMADSFYEYLPKQHLLLAGGTPQYQQLYQNAMVAMKRNIFFKSMTADNRDLLIPGSFRSDGTLPVEELKTDPEAQHLGCFAGSMVALGAKLFGNEEEIDIARRLVEGCLWAYEVAPLGIMPEVIHTVPCPSTGSCDWDEQRWKSAVQKSYGDSQNAQTIITKYHLPKGFSKIDDSRYTLRPEAIESIFVLYRLTGDADLRDRAWNMFENIIRHTKTKTAHAVLNDCTVHNSPKSDRMESFWTAETLKYFYLLYAESDLLSLDDYVFNTEGHPLKRPR